MQSHLVAAPILIPLVSVIATLLFRRYPTTQRVTSLIGGVSYTAVGWLLAWRTVLAPGASGAVAYQVGGWPAPFGITLVADGLSVFMLVIAGAVGLASLSVAIRFMSVDNQQVFYHPLFHCLLAGVSGAFLTGDLFNLFVWFEVMLMASYVFVSFYGEAEHTAAAVRYLALNVIGGAVMLLAVGGLYATTGTLNMADLSRRLADPAGYGIDIAPVLGLSGLLIATFALKAGLAPFQFWVPAAYRSAPLPVAAMLAGVTKKVGIYAIIRLTFTVLAGTPAETTLPWTATGSTLSFFATVLGVMAIASIAIGGLGAVSPREIDEVLAYSSIGQVGFIVIPLAIAAAAHSPALRHIGIAAALIYALHHALAKSLLFLSTAAVRGATGTNNLSELGGLAPRAPGLALVFFVGGVTLIGVPPLAGFFGKFLVFEAAIRHATAEPGVIPVVVLTVLLLGGILTIIYTTRVWIGSFWGTPTPAVETASGDSALPVLLLILAGVVIGVGIGFEQVYQFAQIAADAAIDRASYVDVVDPAGGVA